MRKSTVLTFIFAWCPGAGQMYHGYMKRGLSLLVAFCGIIAVAGMLNLDIFMLGIPVVMVYSFFDTFNIAHLTPEQRAAQPDAYLFHINSFSKADFAPLLQKRHKLLGAGVIFLGAYMLYRQFIAPMLYELVARFDLYWVNNILMNIPMIIIALLLIGFGASLMRGKTPSAFDVEKEFTLEKGNENHDL
ncbi:MAG: hypothetical protein KBG54_06920 [Oscillospiraceae bacterium]|nr:hypothetical protein [Oscillospiraceae bacterium]